MMLTADLLLYTSRGDKVSPRFASPEDAELLERAEELRQLFLLALDERWTRGQIEAEVEERVGDQTDHKRVRGFAKVLLDLGDFGQEEAIDAMALRERVFLRAAERAPLARPGGPAGFLRADDVLAEIAAELNAEQGPEAPPWGLERLRRALYCDLKEEAQLQSAELPQSAEQLIRRYNMVLVQSLLLRATSLTLSLRQIEPKRLRQLFRALKFHELMFQVRRPADGGLLIEVDGPESLLKQSTRYGLQLGTFFLAAARFGLAWSLEARLALGGRSPRLLSIDHQAPLESHAREVGLWRSRAEQMLAQRWAEAQVEGWEMGPGELLELGGQELLIPDLTFRKGDRVAHLDIIGYWRANYLSRRLERCPPQVVLAVSRRLLGEGTELSPALRAQVISFAEVIPLKELLARLERCARPPGL
jgi:predicted nuclease of restriction endonuclease-like RecB superfamily